MLKSFYTRACYSTSRRFRCSVIKERIIILPIFPGHTFSNRVNVLRIFLSYIQVFFFFFLRSLLFFFSLRLTKKILIYDKTLLYFHYVKKNVNN